MKSILVTLATGLLVAGCATAKGGVKSDVRGTTAGEYYPLKVGNSWTYQVNFLGEDHTDSVVIEKEAEGFFVDTQGTRTTVDAYGVRDDKRYLLREPVESGTTWTNVVSVETAEHYKILSVGAACTVPAGKFPDCVVVESRVRVKGGNLINELTFARGVGVVRVDMVLEANGKRIPQTRRELSAWQLAAAAPAPTK